MTLTTAAHELIRDLFRTIIGLSVVGVVWDLGRQAILDPSTVSAILGAAVGIVGTTGAIAVKDRVTERVVNGMEEREGRVAERVINGITERQEKGP